MSVPWRSILGEIQVSTENCTDPGLGLTYVGPFTFPSYWGQPTLLKEYVTPDEVGPHRDWKSFSHYKLRTNDSSAMCGVPVIIQDNSTSFGRCILPSPYACSPFYYGAPGEPISGLPEFISQSTGAIPAPVGLDGLVQRGLSSTLPIIKSELSLLNSLIELRDFKSLPETLHKVDTFLSNTVQRVFTYDRGATLREAFRTASDGYLQLKFNILPLLSDIAGIRTALSKFEKRINALVSQQGSPQTRHFSVNLSEYANTAETGPFIGNMGQFFPKILMESRLERFVTYSPTVFHFEIEYNYNFTRYQAEHALILGLLDYLGVNLNPQIIWNAIPWSFVVDWVANVGNYLSQFRVSNLEPVINIQRCLWSVRRARTIHCSKVTRLNFTNNHDTLRTQTELPETTETAYRRTVFVPSSSSIQLSGVNPQEFTLGAALVLSRRRRRNNK